MMALSAAEGLFGRTRKNPAVAGLFDLDRFLSVVPGVSPGRNGRAHRSRRTCRCAGRSCDTGWSNTDTTDGSRVRATGRHRPGAAAHSSAPAARRRRGRRSRAHTARLRGDAADQRAGRQADHTGGDGIATPAVIAAVIVAAAIIAAVALTTMIPTAGLGGQVQHRLAAPRPAERTADFRKRFIFFSFAGPDRKRPARFQPIGYATSAERKLNGRAPSGVPSALCRSFVAKSASAG